MPARRIIRIVSAVVYCRVGLFERCAYAAVDPHGVTVELSGEAWEAA
jgi:hypothetical protein